MEYAPSAILEIRCGSGRPALPFFHCAVGPHRSWSTPPPVPPSLASSVAGGPAALAPVPALLSPAAYGYYPANAGFAVASPAHRGVVGFPAVADGPAGRGRVTKHRSRFISSVSDVNVW